MLHNNAAQQRHGEKPALAQKASQTIPRAQGRESILISTLKRHSQHEDTQAASLTDGNMDTSKARTARLCDWTLRPLQNSKRISSYMTRLEYWGKIPSCHPGLHDTIPSGKNPSGKDTGKPARSSDLSRGQSKECYPGMRHRDCRKNQYQASTKKRQATLRLQQLLNTHTPHC